MYNMFNLVLMIITFISGIFWFLKYFKLTLTKQQLPHNCNKLRAANTKILNIDYITKENINKLNWIENFASIFPVLLLVFMVRSFIFEPFQIPSGSMMPTLLAGDFIIVEKFNYGIKNPITQNTLIKIGHPKRGDIVVFKYPLDPSIDYIKRVIGLPGDRIIYDVVSKRINIQPNYSSIKKNVSSLPINYSNFSLSNFTLNFKSTINGKINSIFLKILPDKQMYKSIYLTQCKESLGDKEYNILIIPEQRDQLNIYYKQPGIPTSEWIVPQGKYFMMGDNRDNSADSRYWGFVPEKNLVGKAVAIWMSIDKKEGKGITSLRLNRIGSIY